jgi:hypothetical protein
MCETAEEKSAGLVEHLALFSIISFTLVVQRSFDSRRNKVKTGKTLELIGRNDFLRTR